MSRLRLDGFSVVEAHTSQSKIKSLVCICLLQISHNVVSYKFVYFCQEMNVTGRLHNAVSLTWVEGLCSCWLLVLPFDNDFLSHLPADISQDWLDASIWCAISYVLPTWLTFRLVFSSPDVHILHKNVTFFQLEYVLMCFCNSWLCFSSSAINVFFPGLRQHDLPYSAFI